MSKAFTTESDRDPDEDLEDVDPLPAGAKNYMTPAGHAALVAELEALTRVERPRIVEIVSWAAGNGDRSENGDYLYNKKRLREIDRRIRYLTKRLDQPEVVDPARQQGLDRIFFGATVTYVRISDDTEMTVQLVGVDEANLTHGKINWLSPVGRALMKAQVGENVTLRSAAGNEELEVIRIAYLIER